MEFRRLVSQFQELDVTEEQAEVYLRLLQSGPAKVSDLAAFFDMSRSKLYRLLDELCDIGFASKSLGRPIEYSPTSPESIFEAELEKSNQHQKRIQALHETLATSLENLRGEPVDNGDHHWKLLEGIPQIYETLKMALGQAEESVIVASNHDVTTQISLPFINTVWRLTCQRASEGVDVKILLDITESQRSQLEEDYDLAHVALRSMKFESTVHFSVIDGKEGMIWARPEPRGLISQRDDVAVWTDAPGILTTHTALFKRLWKENEPG